jgi:hypothetical protein
MIEAFVQWLNKRVFQRTMMRTASGWMAHVLGMMTMTFSAEIKPKFTEYPPEVANVEVERVTVEGSFESSSTLVPLSMPISLCAYFCNGPGFSLVGFVKSRNLVVDKHAPTQQHAQQTLDPQ